jgi:hypothetical protein
MPGTTAVRSMLLACKHFDRMRGRTRAHTRARVRIDPMRTGHKRAADPHPHASVRAHTNGRRRRRRRRRRMHAQQTARRTSQTHANTAARYMPAAVAELTSSDAGSSWSRHGSRWRLRESSPNDKRRALRRDAALCPTFLTGVSSCSMISCNSCRRLWSRIKACRDCIFVPTMKPENSMPKITWNVQASEE